MINVYSQQQCQVDDYFAEIVRQRCQTNRFANLVQNCGHDAKLTIFLI